MDAGRQSEPLTDIALRTLPGSRSASDSACVVRFRSWRHRSLCTGIVPTSAVPGCKRHHRGHRFRAKGGGFALFCSWCARFIWALRSAGSCLHLRVRRSRTAVVGAESGIKAWSMLVAWRDALRHSISSGAHRGCVAAVNRNPTSFRASICASRHGVPVLKKISGRRGTPRLAARMSSRQSLRVRSRAVRRMPACFGPAILESLRRRAQLLQAGKSSGRPCRAQHWVQAGSPIHACCAERAGCGNAVGSLQEPSACRHTAAPQAQGPLVDGNAPVACAQTYCAARLDYGYATGGPRVGMKRAGLFLAGQSGRVVTAWPTRESVPSISVAFAATTKGESKRRSTCGSSCLYAS